jgi:hypothetical protein
LKKVNLFSLFFRSSKLTLKLSHIFFHFFLYLFTHIEPTVKLDVGCWLLTFIFIYLYFSLHRSSSCRKFIYLIFPFSPTLKSTLSFSLEKNSIKKWAKNFFINRHCCWNCTIAKKVDFNNFSLILTLKKKTIFFHTTNDDDDAMRWVYEWKIWYFFWITAIYHLLFTHSILFVNTHMATYREVKGRNAREHGTIW